MDSKLRGVLYFSHMAIFEKLQKFFSFEKVQKSVTFATTCWEKDWKKILLDSSYLSEKQIANHCYPFEKKIVVINNVMDPKSVKKAADKLVDAEVIDEWIYAEDHQDKVLSFFQLDRKTFTAGPDAHLYENVNNDWVYYNARGILTALYFSNSEYFLYMTGDSFVDQPTHWIGKSIATLEKDPSFKVANLLWNEAYLEAKKESYRQKSGFFVSRKGFSDQCFLVRVEDFKKPIYHEVLADATQYPRGDVLEKRIFSYMKNRDWKRLTYKHGSYMHRNIEG